MSNGINWTDIISKIGADVIDIFKKSETETQTTQAPMEVYKQAEDIGTFDRYIPVALVLISMIAVIAIIGKRSD